MSIVILEAFKLDEPVEISLKKVHYVGVSAYYEKEAWWKKPAITEKWEWYADERGTCWLLEDDSYARLTTAAFKEQLDVAKVTETYTELVNKSTRFL